MTDMTNLKHEKPKHPPLDFELKKPLEEIIKKIPYFHYLSIKLM